MWFIILAMVLAGHAQGHSVPNERLTILSRGANISTTFEHKANLALDLDRIKAIGFRHVRVFINLDDLPDGIFQAKLDQLVRMSVDRKLGIILCMISKQHPWTDQSDVEAIWTAAWRGLAERHRMTSPSYLFLEIANEPSMQDQPRWASIQARLHDVLRTILPDHTLLLTGSPTQMVWALPPVSEDPNVVYTWHLYQPMIFTVQGATWSDPKLAGVRGLIYPPEPGNVHQFTQPSTIDDLVQYLHEGPQMMWREIDAGQKWASEHGAATLVSEFGVYRDAPPASRARWLQDARTRIEASHQGWTVWEYDGGFGVTPLIPGSELMRALGFNS